MIHSKIIQEPNFKSLPVTDAADIKENIDNWLERNNENKIKTFLTKNPHDYESFHKGYRFIKAADLEEDVETQQKVLGININITFHRKVCTPDHFCPLYFREDYKRSYVTIRLPNAEESEFKSDNNLKIRIREFKNKQING